MCLSNIAHQQNGPTNWLKTTEKVQINFCCSSLHFFGEGMHFMQVVTVRCHFFQAHAFRTLVTLIFLTKQLQKHFLRKKAHSCVTLNYFFVADLSFSICFTNDSLYEKMSPSHLETVRLLHTQISSATLTHTQRMHTILICQNKTLHRQYSLN